MRIQTLILYLLGSRKAILEIAANPWAVLLGFVFVLSAGLAREYDAEDLLHEPWHALLPIPASLGTSFLLYCLSYRTYSGLAWPGFWRGYRMFLGLFWLTAPLAWLYAVPYERFLGPGDATRANLYTLGLVALWRVLLMCRVLHVLMGYKGWQAFALVFMLGDVEVFLAGLLSPFPLIEVMGGIRYTESELVLRVTMANVAFISGCSFPVLLIAGFVAAMDGRPSWRVVGFEPAENTRPSGAMVGLAVISVLAWGVVLPFTQPEQFLRRNVEKLLEFGQFEAALDEMSSHGQGDFPPNWDPPPRPYRSQNERLHLPLEIIEAIENRPVAPWVRELYIAKLTRFLYSPFLKDGQIEKAAALLDTLPEGPNIQAELKAAQKRGYLIWEGLLDPAKRKSKSEPKDADP